MEVLNLKVYELDIVCFLLKDIEFEDSLNKIGNLIDKSLFKIEGYENLHDENRYKNYVFNSFYPVERDRIYKAGKIYIFKLRTLDENLAKK